METTCVQYWNRFCPTIFGTGALEELVTKAKEFKMHKILFVTEKALMDLKVSSPIKELLEDAGFEVVVFDDIIADPNNHLVTQGAALAKETGIDGIVAVGGGSSMDCAKGIAMMTKNEGTIEDYYVPVYPPDPDRVKKGFPLITIPTTAGTGSENSPYAVITDAESGLKKIPQYSADLALIDPVMTYTLPKSQTAATGMDVLAHCIEAITTCYYNHYANLFAINGIQLVFKYLPRAVKDGQDKEAREWMMMGANLGGLAIAEASAQFGHAFGHCMGSKYHKPHGLCCAWGTPAAIAVACKYYPEGAKIVADAMDIAYDDNTTMDELCAKMTDKVVALMQEIGIPSMKASGYTLEDCQSVSVHMPDDAAFLGIPKENMPQDEIKSFIQVAYEAYQ